MPEDFRSFLLTTQLSVEGPIRMKEECVEGLIEIPRINEESLPEQLKGLLGQTAGALQQLPSPIRDAVSIKIFTDLVWQRLDEVNGDGVFLTSNFTPFKAETSRNDSWNEQQAMTSTVDYLAQFDNTSGNSDLELAIALQQQEFERQPQRFQAPPPQQQQQ
ncbi:uncharacterized protein [Miscanthus floridulus]|uniref:uncharacterized protein n=1 Tax=Miscanthus floridulus TaxID=154761 RepID=UPI00345B169B